MRRKLKQENMDLRLLNIKMEEQITRLSCQIKKLIEVNKSKEEEIEKYIEEKEKLQNRIELTKQILLMDTNELKIQPNNFPRPVLNKETGKWETTTAFCSIGGCEYRCHINDTERDAFQWSVLASIDGKDVDTNHACPKCYQEYMKGCM